MLDTAIFWFSKGITWEGERHGDGNHLANAWLVGRARAELQKGDKAPPSPMPTPSLPASRTR